MCAPGLEYGSDLQPAELGVPPVPGVDRWDALVYAHTHWDREWYRSFERFRMQLVGVIDRLLQLLDTDPSFTRYVLDGQTIVLEDYLALRPEEEPRLRRLVGAGRIEVGPWYVLPDEFLVSGEALVRNLLEGRRVAARFGEPLAVGYLPDPFGHVAQLPAILRGFGIDNVVFSRGMGDEFERTGTEFRWEAPGGKASVLALVQASTYTSGYCNAELLARGNGASDAEPYEALLELAPHLARHARTSLLLIAAGCDHETVQEALPEQVRRLAALLPEADVRIAGLAEAIQCVRDGERARDAAGMPLERVRGELRGSLQAPILASIFSARIPIKQSNDSLQVLLERHVEPVLANAVLAGVRPARDVEPFLRHAWRLVLENHPHDSIGGCSVDEVHDEMHARSLRARAVCEGLLEDLRIALDLGDVDALHDAEGRGGIAERGDGTPLAIRRSSPGRLVALEPNVRRDGAEVVDERTVRSGSLVARVVDGRLELESGSSSTRIEWIDEADAGDEYDFGALAGDEPIVATLERWSTGIAGPGVAQLDLHYALDLPRSLTSERDRRSSDLLRHNLRVRVRVSDVSPLAQLVVEFDNQALDHRLRLRASVDGLEPDTRVHALGHFAVIDRLARPVATATTWRQPSPGLDHCAGAVRTRDVLLAGRGIHEYEARGTHLELTVLRSVGWLSRNDVAGRPSGHAGPALAAPGAQCQGAHRVDLAIGLGDDASFDDARAFLAPPLVLERFGIGQSSHPRPVPGAPHPIESGAAARARDVLAVTPADARARIDALGIELGGEGVVPSACRLADDGSGDLVVRWWAPDTATDARVRLSIAARVRSILRARLDETPLGPVPPLTDGRCELRVEPGSITTLRIAVGEAT
jgi:alpha-mannosidase